MHQFPPKELNVIHALHGIKKMLKNVTLSALNNFDFCENLKTRLFENLKTDLW